MPSCHRVVVGVRKLGVRSPEFFPSLFICLALCLPCAAANPSSGTAPFIFDGNRIYAELAFVRPDGTLHKSLAFVDLGSPSTIVSEALFRELQLDQKKPLTFNIGDMPIHVDSSAVTGDTWLPFSIADNRRVEALLSAGIMQKYQVVIDYAHRALTLAQPGTLQPAGSPVPCRINEKTGLVAIDVSVDRQTYPVTIDNGSAYTWLRKETVEMWLAVHPDWQRGIGAVGVSNMRMEDDGIEAAGILVRIPKIKLGSFELRRVGLLAIGPSTSNWDFIDWYAQKNAVPVIGWLGGNVLQNFRVTIDYPNRKTYWLPQTVPDSHDLDQVGLTLKKRAGEYFVAAVASQHGKPTVDGVQVGDKLLQIGMLHTDGATPVAVLSAMHGKPSELRTLLLERNAERFTVQAKVTAF